MQLVMRLVMQQLHLVMQSQPHPLHLASHVVHVAMWPLHSLAQRLHCTLHRLHFIMPQDVQALYRQFDTLASFQEWRLSWIGKPESAALDSDTRRAASQIHSRITSEAVYTRRRERALAHYIDPASSPSASPTLDPLRPESPLPFPHCLSPVPPPASTPCTSCDRLRGRVAHLESLLRTQILRGTDENLRMELADMTERVFSLQRQVRQRREQRDELDIIQ